MHLEDMFRLIEEKRSEFIAKRAANIRFVGSATGLFSPEGDTGGKSPDEKIEAELTQVEVAAGK